MVNLQENIRRVQERIRRAAERVGRAPDEITLVAVSKTFPASIINEAIRLGIRHIGENRVQEARQKFPEVDPAATRHMVGYLQRNKVKYAVQLFDMIQSVDRYPLAEEIHKRCEKLGKVMPVLIEVNTSGEASKSGCAPEEALSLLEQVDALPHLQVRGFMTIAIFSDDPEKVRPCFVKLRKIYEEARARQWQHARIDTLSMGMSSDFEIAIEEGSTMVRIGTAIFGPRTAIV